MFRLIEEAAGAGELSRFGSSHQRVTYRLKRFQGFLGDGGMPVPGLYRVEGRIDFPDNADTTIAGECATLRLEDGRSLEVTFGPDGSFESEGRHPRGCACC